MPPKKKPPLTFEVRFVAQGLVPEEIPLRAVSDALSAVQDLASGRDPAEVPQVPAEKRIALMDVRRGSAVYSCVARTPREATANLASVGAMLSSEGALAIEDERLIAALHPIEALSKVARSVRCHLEVAPIGRHERPLLVVEPDAYDKISQRVLLRGDTTVVGEVERVGGATKMRCLLRVPGRRRLLYCDLESKELVRRLGQHLYERIAATGTAQWIHSTWKIYRFTIRDFSQPKLGDPKKAIAELRSAGLDAWDTIANPEEYMRELRS